ncbi:MAG: flagellar export protein FliJ [Ignavibacteriales bacterium]
MAKFHYRFESIKKVKETLEKKVQKEISLIDMEIEKSNESLQLISDEKAKARKIIAGRNNVRVSELQFHNEVEQLLELKAKKIREEVCNLEKAKENKIAELAQKTKEHRIFETLEERHYEDYLLLENQAEQKEIDEIATKKFAREG